MDLEVSVQTASRWLLGAENILEFFSPCGEMPAQERLQFSVFLLPLKHCIEF